MLGTDEGCFLERFSKGGSTINRKPEGGTEVFILDENLRGWGQGQRKPVQNKAVLVYFCCSDEHWQDATWVRKGLLSLHFQSQSITEESQGRDLKRESEGRSPCYSTYHYLQLKNSLHSRISWNQWRVLLACSLRGSRLVSFLTHSRTTCLGNGASHSGPGPHRHSSKPIRARPFLNEGSPLRWLRAVSNWPLKLTRTKVEHDRAGCWMNSEFTHW